MAFLRLAPGQPPGSPYSALQSPVQGCNGANRGPQVRRNACFPRRERVMGRGKLGSGADWPKSLSLCPAWVKSSDLSIKQVLVSVLELPFRSLESSRHFTNVIFSCAVAGQAGAGVRWLGFTSEPCNLSPFTLSKTSYLTYRGQCQVPLVRILLRILSW